MLAVESGCKGIIVSNHGARQIDTVQATVSNIFFLSFFDFHLIRYLYSIRLKRYLILWTPSVIA